MPLDYDAVVHKKYTVEPLARGFIPSIGEPKAQILWVGCSDSWITETDALDVLPEETFVHRNLGSIVSNGDLSSQSAIAYAVDLLKVKHIVICGHYDCGLIKANDDPTAIHGWYKDITELSVVNEEYLHGKDPAMDEEDRDRHLVEVYVLAETEWLKRQPTVAKAIQERGLQVHAFVFDKERKASARLVEIPQNPVKKSPPFSQRCGTAECTGSCLRSQLVKDTAF